MCLHHLDDRVKEKYGKKEFGWKVFSQYDDELEGAYTGGKIRPRKQWLREDRFRTDRCSTKILNSQLIKYPTGWHIYLLRQDARKNRWKKFNQHSFSHDVVKKVQFRRPVAWGRQDGCPIVVAKEIFIE